MFDIDVMTQEEAKAAEAASAALAEADLNFLIMIHNDDGKGAILCNIEPGKVIAMLETMLATVKAAPPNITKLPDEKETLQ